MPCNQQIKVMKNKSNAACSITLDVASESLTEVELINYLEANDITYHVLTWNGPGGGNPEVQFFGTHAALEKFIYEQYTSNDKEQDEYIVSLIEPA